MKKNLLLLLVPLLLTSCKSLITYYEICDVVSTLSSDAHGKYSYHDSACSVVYDFWSNGGDPGCDIINNTSEYLYIDLSKSFFIKNGLAYDYYLKQTISTTTSYAEILSSTKSGTMLGYWNLIGGGKPGSYSVSFGKSNASSQSFTISTEAKDIIIIPPHSSKHISEYTICDAYFYSCEHNIKPKHASDTYNYELNNSPVSFSNFITYRIGSDPTEHSFTNSFFIGSVTFYHEKAITEWKKIGCNKDEEEVKVIKDASPQKFYIKYSRADLDFE